VVIPLFFLSESLLDTRLREFVGLIARSGVVPENALPALRSEIARTGRWRDSWLPEIMCLLATVLLTVFATRFHLSGKTSAADPVRVIDEFRLAGAWYWFVCLPLFRFLMFRWLWRVALWWCFLWRVARLRLHLVATHPDGAGGLGPVENQDSHFGGGMIQAPKGVCDAPILSDGRPMGEDGALLSWQALRSRPHRERWAIVFGGDLVDCAHG
jgi:hypothetical protein